MSHSSKKRLSGIALDNRNHAIFVASSSTNAEIMKVTLAGKIIKSVGKTGTCALEFYTPSGVCLTSDGLLLVADYGNKRVQVLKSADLSFVRCISCLSKVHGVSTDHNGNIHAATTDRVEVFSITGEKITEYGQGVLGMATDVAFLPNSKCQYSFVPDRSSLCIFDGSINRLIHTFPKGISAVGVTIDQEGAVIICDNTKNGTMQKLLF